MSPRLNNYTLYRNRHTPSEELPWVRPAELAKRKLLGPVVLVNGAFDLLHSGHTKLIFAAREKAATLVCALDSDERVRKGKGRGRPVLKWIERATALGYMPIDYLVEIGSDAEMKELVKAINPVLRVQSEEYKNKISKFPQVPKMFVRLGNGMSTSEIIRRVTSSTSE